jgi:hypothetical protein
MRLEYGLWPVEHGMWPGVQLNTECGQLNTECGKAFGEKAFIRCHHQTPCIVQASLSQPSARYQQCCRRFRRPWQDVRFSNA